MKKNTKLFLLHEPWYQLWIFLPIAAYGIGMLEEMIYYFPLLLIASQYLAIRVHPASQHPAWWWTWLLGSILSYGVSYEILESVFIRLGLSTDYSYVQNVTHFILSYYISQIPAEVLMALIFPQWRIGQWTCGNGLAAIGWMGLFLVLYYFTSFPYSPGNRFSFFWGFVGPSFVGNCITGYFLHAGTED